jgi:hypothetical protein
LLAHRRRIITEDENGGTLDDVGGVAYLVGLISAQCGWMAGGDYAQTIYDTCLRRELIPVSEAIALWRW